MRAPTRLPVQHPRAPHCLRCKASLPSFDDVHMAMGCGDGEFTLLAITFHIRCECGALWNVKKRV